MSGESPAPEVIRGRGRPPKPGKGLRKVLCFGDVHFPQHNPQALSTFLAVVRAVKPDLVVALGDILDCKAFSTHAPDADGDSPYAEEVGLANKMFDAVQKNTKHTVYIEGNHEYRVIRKAQLDRAAASVVNMLTPKHVVAKGRKDFTYIPYNPVDGQYSHYKIAPWLLAVHGWSTSRNAARDHLIKAQGKSIVFGHIHRAAYDMDPRLLDDGFVESVSAGCLCQRTQLYACSSPVYWVNGFVQIFLGSQSHSSYFVPISKGACILPDGREIKGD